MSLNRILETVSTVVFVLACGSAAGQGVMKTAPAPNRNITLAGPQKNGAPSGPALPGTIEGFVYWDTGAVTHNPAGACDGFSISVIAGGHVLQAASGQFGAKYIGQVKSYLVGGKVVAYDVCTYAYDNVAENVPLRVQLNVAQPASFSTVVAPATPIVGPVTIINAQCNMLPDIVTATLADLTAHWGSCQNMAFDVNFQLTPASLATRAAMLSPGTRTLAAPAAPGAANGSSSSGALLTPGSQKTLLGDGSVQPGASGLSGVQRQTITDGTLTGNIRPSGTPQVGASQTKSAQGSAPGGTLVRDPSNAAALAATPSSKPRASAANTMMTVCKAEIVKGQVLTVISAVNGRGVAQVPFAGGSAPGTPIIAGVFSGAAVFTPGEHYIIQGCGFGTGTGQVFIQSGFYSAGDPQYFQVKLYPNQWSDQRIDVEVDPSASGPAQPVLLVVLTASTKTAVPQMGAGVGEATAFGFSFAPNSGSTAGSTPVPSKVQGRNQYDAVTLDRGVTRDPGFANWANEKGSPSTTGAKPAVNAGDVSGASTGTNTSAKTADDLNPQPYPPKGTSTANNGTTSGSASAQSREAEKQLRAQLAKAPVPAKVIRIAAKMGATSAHAAMLAVLEKQRQVANIESAQMKLGIRPQTQSVVLGQQSQLMSATGGGSAGGMAPQASVSQAASPAQGSSNSGSGSGGTGASSGKTSSSMASLSYARTLIIECANDPTMRIVSVSGSSYPATFTPIDQYNLYTIRGCSFGDQAPTSDQSPTDWVHVYGGTGSFYGKFAIRFWSDNEIDVSLDESISGFPDLDNLNLVVKRSDGKQTQKGGFKFYAARQTVPLQAIPQSWAKLTHFPNTWSSNYSSPPASGFLYPKPAISAPGPSAGSAYVSRSADGQRFDIVLPTYDYYDFSHLAPGWTTDSFEIDPYEASCPADSGWTVTYKQSFGTWTGDWDGNNVRVGLSDTSCSGFWAPCVAAPWTCQNYQNWSGSYYALKVWVIGPRGTDPLTDKPAN